MLTKLNITKGLNDGKLRREKENIRKLNHIIKEYKVAGKK
jgi:hypothetical protein